MLLQGEAVWPQCGEGLCADVRDAWIEVREEDELSFESGFTVHVAVRRVGPDGDGFVMVLDLPLVDKERLELTRVGDELVVSVAGRRRVLALPSALRRCQVRRARVEGDQLLVTFEPDPEKTRLGDGI